MGKIHMVAAIRRLGPLAFAMGIITSASLVGLTASAYPQAVEKIPSSPLVHVDKGEMPIIISAPHGGTKEVPGVSPRKGEGLQTGGSGFFAARDSGTEELANSIAHAVAKRSGKKPYLVVALFHRKYIDANRPPEIAYEDDKAKQTYEAYRQTLASYCREVKKIYGSGLLLDVHGQDRMKEHVIRGTKDGKTVGFLVHRFGEKAHTGPESFFGLLAGNGCKVFPENLSDKEYSALNGGNIVQTYGSENYGIDAMQLEFGSSFREKGNVSATADKVATAIDKFTKLYLAQR